MADQRERIGQNVGDYRLLQWLGGGGFGNIYLAEHLKEKHVASCSQNMTKHLSYLENYLRLCLYNHQCEAEGNASSFNQN